MQRVAFQLQIREGKTEEYDEAHRHVWPELIREMEFFGIAEYSIFRRGVQLFLYMHVPDWDQLLVQLTESELNQRWQSALSTLFEPIAGLAPGEPFALMREVFYMAGCDQEHQDAGERE